jgi:hypothetical protein
VPLAIRLSPNKYHPHNAVALVQCDLKLEIDDLLKEPEISVKEYFTTLKWDRSAELTRGELTYMGRLAVWQVFTFIGGGPVLSTGAGCPSSYKMGHRSGLSFGGSGSFV